MQKNRRKRTVMLATPFEEKRLKTFPSYVIFQPKLRGARMQASKIDGEILLKSSTGREIMFQNELRAELRILFSQHFFSGVKPITLDGELYTPGLTQEEINGIVNATKNDPGASLIYNIFDTTEELLVQKCRFDAIKRLETIINIFDEFKFLKIVPSCFAQKGLWNSYLERFLEEGYEGLIIRHPEGQYVPKRSKDLLKVKPTEEDFYEICGYEEGTGWAKGSLGAFTVKDREGSTFNVGTGSLFTKSLRLFMWEHRETFIGKLLCVKHERIKTNSGLPVCTVGLSVWDNGEKIFP